jgi:hypothetical protein
MASVEIDKGNPGEDDDWIIFMFGDDLKDYSEVSVNQPA